jgi:transcriptional repressor NF-X1
MNYCPCGATPLSVLQKQDCSDGDSAPTCGRRCGKKLLCSTSGEQHICRSQCHNGPCPPCTKSRVVQCIECKDKVRLDCQDLKQTEEYICGKCFKPCNKVKNCGRHWCYKHKCQGSESSHLCDKVCNRRFGCGNHDCDQPCHSGECKTCPHTSIQKLECGCGEDVLVPCGATLPTCKKPCARMHACDHEATHMCHNKDACPPCTTLTEKMCAGGHKTITMPCYTKATTCDSMCGKILPCGQHQCQRKCHDGYCTKNSEKCKQLCQTLRNNCWHMCRLVCHASKDCPKTNCMEKLTVTCKCGKIKQQKPCFLLVTGSETDHKFLQSPQEILQCDSECRRNSQANLSHDRTNDMDFMDFVKSELEWFTEQAKKGLVEPRYKFAATSKENRRIIHSLAPHYGCSTDSYGTGPRRYTVVSYVGQT